MPRLAVLLLLFAAPAALAQTCTISWVSAGGGLWEESANWEPARAPEPADTVCITLDGTYTVAQSRSDRTIGGLVVGGASGTQTLTTNNVFVIAGDGVIRPNGVLEILNRVPGGGDGLYATGTLTVEGLLLYKGSDLFSDGGTLDVAPGGTLRIADNAGAGGTAATFRIRGLLESVGTSTTNVGATLDVQGGTLRASSGRLDLLGGGTLHDATLDAAAGANLWLRGPFTATGTLEGTPAGTLFVTGTTLAAGPGGATLAVGGTGLQLSGSAFLTSAGGSFTNAGLLRKADTGSNFAGFSGVVVTNRSTVDIPSFRLENGAVLRNEPGATVLLRAGGSLSGNGRLDNAGLILREGGGGTYSLGGLLRSLPGSEIRSNEDRTDLASPGSQAVPDGVTLTGVGRFGIGRDLDIQGTVSPGTDAVPLARLTFESAYRPSEVAGSPRLVIDVDAGGRSDTLNVLFSSGPTPNVRLAGALIVRVRAGYTPAVGDVFTVMTNGRAITGAFTQVVAEGAPDGIAFVTELSADTESLFVRAVETAPGGPITVSATEIVAGGPRPVFLSGPGAVGVASARLECVECLDPGTFGTLPGTLVGAGTSLVEARFDLTSVRAFGRYELVIGQPGLPDLRVPLTVRPYVSYVRAYTTVGRGIRVRPAGQGYNWSAMNMRGATNTPEPSYTLGAVGPEDAGRTAFALSTPNPLGGGRVFFRSEDAADPAASALVFARLPRGAAVPLSVGQRIDPAEILFPEQSPTGPDDPRLAFGAPRLFDVTGVQHLSFARARIVIETALRATDAPALAAYLAAADAAGPAVVSIAVGDALGSAPRYVGGLPALLRLVLDRLDATVPTPTGLADDATPAFDTAVDLAGAAHYRAVEQAYRIDLADAPTPVRDLLAAEYDALAAPEALALGGGSGGTASCPSPPRSATPPPNTIGGAADLARNAAMCVAQGAAPPPTNSPPVDPSSIGSSLRSMGRGVSNIARSVQASIGRQRGGSCGAGGGAGGGGGVGGGTGCMPPAAPADPNDKTADTDLMCAFGTVLVDGEPQTRCVRYFVPLSRASEPIVYTVQFENLPQATANAEFVTITDTLDAALDPATLAVYATSSDSTFSVSREGQVVTFRFVGIDLPPNVPEPVGQGFVTFGVSPRGGLPAGTLIDNRARIVFDFNPPIATPTVRHELREAADLSTIVLAPDRAEPGAPLPFDVVVANVQGDPASEVSVVIAAGAGALTATPSVGTCTGTGPVTCALGTLGGEGVASIALTLADPPEGEVTLSAAVSSAAFDPFAANDVDAALVAVTPVSGEAAPDALSDLTLATPMPNPARAAVTMRWGLPAAGSASVRVFDLLGREVAVLADEPQAAAGWHESRLDARMMASGVYVVQLAAERNGRLEVRTRRLLVVR